MKTTATIFIVIFTFLSVFAQEKKEENDNRKIRTGHLSFGLPQLFLSSLNVGIEKDFMKKGSSLQLNGEFTIWEQQQDKHKILGFGGEIYYKIKIFRKTIFSTKRYFHEFIYMAPFFRLDYYEESEEEKGSTQFASPVSVSYNYHKQGTSIAYSGGCVLGVRWTMGGRLDLDFYGGGGIKYPETTGQTNFGRFDNGLLSPAHTGVFIKGGFRAGVSF